MILQDFLYKILFVDLETELKKICPNDNDFFTNGKFKEFYFNLMQLSPTETKGEIRIKPVGSIASTWEIYAFDNEKEYALDLAPWSDWLGMTVDDGIFDYMSEEEFLARCIYTMSFFGFNESERSKNVRQFFDLNGEYGQDVERFVFDVLMELIGDDIVQLSILEDFLLCDE